MLKRHLKWTVIVRLVTDEAADTREPSDDDSKAPTQSGPRSVGIAIGCVVLAVMAIALLAPTVWLLWSYGQEVRTSGDSATRNEFWLLAAVVFSAYPR